MYVPRSLKRIVVDAEDGSSIRCYHFTCAPILNMRPWMALAA